MESSAAVGELDIKLRRRGVIILVFFAAIWAAAGSSGITSNPALITVVVFAIALTVVVVTRVARPDLSRVRPRRLPRNWNRTAGLVNFTEFALIIAAIAGLRAAGELALIPPLVCFIVGVHFLPLARLFGQPQYTWTGALLIVVAVAGFVVFAAGAAIGVTRAVTGLGAACVLWASALHVALRG